MCTHKARSLKSIGSWSMKKDSLLYTYTTIDDRKYDIRWIWHKKSVGRSECGVGKEENMIIALKHLYLRLLKHLTE